MKIRGAVLDRVGDSSPFVDSQPIRVTELELDEPRSTEVLVVIEAVGRGSVLAAAIDLTAPGGRTITVGLPTPAEVVEISPLALVAEGRSVVGSFSTGSRPARHISTKRGMSRDGIAESRYLRLSMHPLAELFTSGS